jgi:tetratricopeptide (TPR) repeat protein
MEWQHTMPTQPLNWAGQVILLEAEPGQSRRLRLQQCLHQAQASGASTWLLSCDRDQGGLWAGLKDLLNDLIPKIQAEAPDLLIKHDYELVSVLPALQRTISVRNPTLTDTVRAHEQVRNYPADRTFRIVHGLIDLLAAWHQRDPHSAWIIACDRFDRAGALVRRFFVELMRRRGQQLHLTLLIATDPMKSDVVSQFDAKYLGQCIRLNLPADPTTSVCQQEMRRLTEELEQQVGEDAIELEIYLPQLIRYCLLSNQPEKALSYQIQACIIYTRRGFYEDGLVYGEAALAQLLRYCPEDMQKRCIIYAKLYGCYTALGRPLQALQVMEETMAKADNPDQLFRGCYMIAMLYARFLLDRDLTKAEAYLERGLQELTRTDLPKHLKLFHTAFNRNGLALLRHRQGRSHEAVEICQFCFEQLNAHLKPNEHLLHRSVLLYNIAQVYTAIGSHEEAISYLTNAMAMDPNYSEYYNDRGNLYFKLGRFQDALQDYLKAIELSPPYWEVWSNLGQCYRHLSKITEALNAFSTAIDLDPNQFSALLARAEVFEMLEQPDAALADYNAALAMEANQPLALANRAILHYDAGCYEEALADLERAIALSPETADLYQNRAVALSSLGRFQEAARDLKTYLQLCPFAEDRPEVESQLLALQTNCQSLSTSANTDSKSR